MKKQKPTALNKRGKKIHFDGYTFDSQKEFDFYYRFIKYSGAPFEIHPKFVLEPKHELADFNTHSIRYTPDVIVYDSRREKMHVYDVKNSFTVYGIDPSVKLRWTLFSSKYGIPVEAVVIRKHDFKVIGFGTTKTRKIDQPLICSDVFYDWHEALRK
ncbi:hypothetical protein IWT140_01728 [Secundilactobacillus pentosiphilus]|uniref:DUF1064 domain-containing protein n=1 Tax=Secundilactobacillus pentosiphilus TaxID=1714682 RepID=A0A1Z5IRN8_9LACO|nr:DUF1064 domain-containing protein [Secundilactobacillus pentosiphilus]GAX04091.1 hypothetical protein IWT140_01728 [Secundilactobacillus pentosiphilus]